MALTFKATDFTEDEENGDLQNKSVTETEDEEIVSEEENEEENVEADADAEAAPKPKQNLNDIILDSDDIPENLRGKNLADFVKHHNELRTFAQGLVNQMNGQKSSADSSEPAEKPTPLFTEDELGVGADPNAVEEKINRIVQSRVEPFINTNLQKTSEDNLRNLIANKEEHPYAERYVNDMLQLAASLPLKQTADPQTWKGLYATVIGLRFKEIEKDIRSSVGPGSTKAKADFVETGKGGGGSSNVGKGKKPVLSSEQKMVAEAMGISEEDYINNALKIGVKLDGKL